MLQLTWYEFKVNGIIWRVKYANEVHLTVGQVQERNAHEW